MYGTTTIVSNSSSCWSDSRHSLSASEINSSSSTEDAVEEEGSESISASEELNGGSRKLSLLDMDMTGDDGRLKPNTGYRVNIDRVECGLSAMAMEAAGDVL